VRRCCLGKAGESKSPWRPVEIYRHRRQRRSQPGMLPDHRNGLLAWYTVGLRKSHALAHGRMRDSLIVRYLSLLKTP
jgi:hypothetical protein